MDTVEGEATSQNWFQREGNACKSMCFGSILVPLIIIVIFWNEEHYVKSQATADIIADAIVTPNCEPLGSNMGSLVFAACQVNAPDIARHLPEPLAPFVQSFNGASIQWQVEIYQWSESSSKNCEKDNSGGQTCHTTYSYDKEWKSGPIRSSSFYAQDGHQNYGELPSNLRSASFTVPPYGIVLSGRSEPVEQAKGFVLDASLQSQLPSGAITPSHVSIQGRRWQPESGNNYLSASMLTAQGNYLTTNPGSPDIGDLRISISGQTAATASICAKQVPFDRNTASVEAWPPQVFDIWGRKTYELEDLRVGLMTKDMLEATIKSENKATAFIIRIVCFILMIVAFQCIFQPLSVAADLLRILNYCTCCLGSILDNAAQPIICCVSFSSACWCFTLVFVVAWMYANPTYAIFGIVILAALSVAGFFAGQSMRGAKSAEGRDPLVLTPYLKLETGEADAA